MCFRGPRNLSAPSHPTPHPTTTTTHTATTHPPTHHHHHHHQLLCKASQPFYLYKIWLILPLSILSFPNESLIIRYVNNTSSFEGRLRKYIFGHQGWVQKLRTQKKNTHSDLGDYVQRDSCSWVWHNKNSRLRLCKREYSGSWLTKIPLESWNNGE